MNIKHLHRMVNKNIPNQVYPKKMSMKMYVTLCNENLTQESYIHRSRENLLLGRELDEGY